MCGSEYDEHSALRDTCLTTLPSLHITNATDHQTTYWASNLLKSTVLNTTPHVSTRRGVQTAPASPASTAILHLRAHRRDIRSRGREQRVAAQVPARQQTTTTLAPHSQCTRRRTAFAARRYWRLFLVSSRTSRCVPTLCNARASYTHCHSALTAATRTDDRGFEGRPTMGPIRRSSYFRCSAAFEVPAGC